MILALILALACGEKDPTHPAADDSSPFDSIPSPKDEPEGLTYTPVVYDIECEPYEEVRDGEAPLPWIEINVGSTPFTVLICSPIPSPMCYPLSDRGLDTEYQIYDDTLYIYCTHSYEGDERWAQVRYWTSE